jgi:hypothetical protein
MKWRIGRALGALDVRIWDGLAASLAWVVVMHTSPCLVPAMRAPDLHVSHINSAPFLVALDYLVRRPPLLSAVDYATRNSPRHCELE